MEGGRLILVAAALGLALALPSCDSEPDTALSASGVAGAVQKIQRWFADGELDRVCARMTESAKVQAGSMAHGKVESCAKDLRQAARLIDFRNSSEVEVIDVKRNGGSATALVALDDWRSEVPLVRQGRRWRLDSFFGIPTSHALDRIGTARDRVPPAATRLARDESVIAVSGGKIRVTLLTVFGNFMFSECEFTFRSFVDRSGRTWTYDFDRGWPTDGASCADIAQCGTLGPGERAAVNPGTPLPWRGRLRRDGDDAYVHRVEACFWTCVGFYEGTLSMRLVRRGRGWRADETDFRIGAHGLRMHGGFTLSGDPKLVAVDDSQR